MRPFGLAVLTVLVVVASAAASDGRYRTAGISVRVAPGWHVVHRRFADCTNPAQRLALTGQGAIVVVQESLDPGRYIRRFPRRPSHFRVEGKASPMECCAVHGRAGWQLHFRDAGRGFYAYIYPGRRGTVASALATLDSLRVKQRRP